MRSSFFLSAYCGLAWLGVDAITPLLPRAGGRGERVFAGRHIAMGPGMLAGLATLLEKRSRRTELALYCAAHALESFARMHAPGRGGLKKGRGRAQTPAWERWRLDVALFSLSASAILGCYSAQRDVFRSKYLSVLDWVLGNQGHGMQRIRHIPSVLSLGSLQSLCNT